MQLPRGRFLTIKKETSIRKLQEEAIAAGFTGYLSFFTGDTRATLVIENGRPILAEFGALAGREAYEKLHSMSDIAVDAELFILSDAQLSLAKEFNRTYTMRTEPEQRARERFAGIQSQERSAEASASERKLAASTAGATRLKPRVAKVVSASKWEDDLSLLDTMDLEKVKRSMRENSRMIAEKLELDHLIKENV
ncbi:hypothetical protein [Methanothrix sp.]|uniref:hypothetical protein n=1 Tax=Methanothrix sp. TaxID=90426 RepID=UPI0034E2D43B